MFRRAFWVSIAVSCSAFVGVACVGDDPVAPGDGGVGPAGSVLQIDPVAHDFGGVDVGKVARKSFTVTNTGSQPTAALSATLEAVSAFRISNDGCKGVLLVARASCAIELEFAPTAFGEVKSSIALSAGETVTTKATLRGQGRDFVTLTVKTDGLGTVTGPGIDCGTDCTETYERGTTAPAVTLTAKPGPGNNFVGWSGGGCKGLTPTCEVKLTESQTVTASFSPKVPLELTLLQGPGGTTTAQSTPAGLSCPGACDKVIGLFDPDTDVTVAPSAGDVFRFDGDCSGKTCVVKMTGPKSVTLRTSGYNYAFVSSAQYDGNLGGLAGADAKCAALADAAKLPGTFKAFLSTCAVNVKDRFTAGGGFVRVDGKILVPTTAAFADNQLRNPLWLDEKGVKQVGDPSAERVFTGTATDLTAYPNAHCTDWTNGATGTGVVSGTQWTGPWSTVNSSPCGTTEHIYCFADDLARPVPFPAITTRRAFVSSATVAASAGVAAMDSLCQSDALAAALPNANKYKALVAPSNGASAASRLTNAGGTKWVRVDGVEAATSAANLLAGGWEAPIDRTASGAPALIDVFTGYRFAAIATPPKLTDAATATCNGWSTAAASTAAGVGRPFGAATMATAAYAETDTHGCDTPHRVYCVED